jgi:hypothetical protein
MKTTWCSRQPLTFLRTSSSEADCTALGSHLGYPPIVWMDAAASASRFRDSDPSRDRMTFLPPGGKMQSPRRAVIALVPVSLVASIVLVLGACGDAPTSGSVLTSAFTPLAAAGSATQTEFDGFICFGPSGTEGTVRVTPGGTTHLKGLTNTNQWVTGNSLIDGIENNTVSGNINRSGDGVVHLDVSLKPTGVNGTWEIRQTLTISGGVPQGSTGIGHGTGDLRGMTIKFTTGSAAPRPSGCGSGFAPFGPELHGTILSPAST